MRADIAIVGAGTAGMTAAIYARRAGKEVLVLEAAAHGGQIVNTPDIENYPLAAHISGFDFAEKVFEQARGLGAEFLYEEVLELRALEGGFALQTPKGAHFAGAVILAAGSRYRRLGLENEERLMGRGVSWCASCDGGFYRGKSVAVVGGGSTALGEALYLSELAEKVTLIHRRESFRGEEMTLRRLREKDNVHFLLNSRVTRLLGERRLEAIEVAGPAETGRHILPLDGLFIAIGREPVCGRFAPLAALDGEGYVLAGEDCHTGTPGLFAAGDCRAKALRQLVTAAADGAMAATEAAKYLNRR